ncbi:aldehyde dehydrogenase family protein [Candidatus Solirubrobacter pratensis]|uniref:aldehyde dehydrogenase family protein n=1 Tax=Candidatus Solirubrobacter pratensis TaxID=1298857 RepID=UPI0003FEBAB6|nr:aldehyde dehydrogenase family protein [Candidatus Solirubrobacter pratensis]
MATVEQAQATIAVENPATGELVREVPLTADVGALVERARAVQPAWEALGYQGRARVLLRARRWLIEHAEEVVATIVSETGKTDEDARLVELAYGANALGFWARKAPKYLADEKVRTGNPFVLGRKLVVRYRPVGVVGVIGPWNYPLVNSVGDAIPALAAGNAVVVKPSEVTPLTSLLIERGLLESGLPEGLYQTAIGGPPTGEALIDAVDMVMFTGSTRTGRKVMERAARTLTPVSLELGGKDPMIVLADADVERAANAAVYYSMQNGGQTCISIERAYVEAPVYDEFVAKVAAKVAKLRQGPPAGPGSIDVGAMTFPPQLDVVARHVQQARDAGARVLTGGRERPGAGRFYEPTVLADVDHSMAAMTEETFGPTLPVMKVADADEAVRLANDSPYGLGAAVFTRDVARGEAIASRIEAGAVCVNDAALNYLALELPMGGWKESGLGVRHGAGGIRKYTRSQALLVTRFAPKREIHYFPYSARVTKLLDRGVKLFYGRGGS